MISEYRALGEVLQAMMITPAHDETDHMKRVRGRSVRDNLRIADYSMELRTFVQSLMEMSMEHLLQMLEQAAGGQRRESGGPPLITNCTSGLYAYAIRGHHAFRANATNPEDRRIVMRDEELRREAAEDAVRFKRYRESAGFRDWVLNEQDKNFGRPLTTYKGKPKGKPKQKSKQTSVGA